jgi:hypothetical protein
MLFVFMEIINGGAASQLLSEPVEPVMCVRTLRHPYF